jgi:hypothetical protein
MARAAENAERRSASVAIETDFKGGCACARQRFYSGAVSALVTTDIAVAPERRAAGHRLARRASWTLFAIAGVLALGSLVIVVTHLSAATRDDGYVRGFGAVLALGYAAIGSRVATRHPRNAVGWLILLTAIGFGVLGLVQEYLIAAGDAPTLLSGPAVRGILVSSMVPTLTGSLFLLLFPDGRLTSRIWSALAVFVVGTNAIAILLVLLVPLPPVSPTPMALQDAARALTDVPLFNLANLGSTLGLALCGGSLLVRLRAARGDERQQLKWVAAAGAFAVTANLIENFGPPSPLLGYLNLAGILSFPVAAGIAIMRYRLYDIDAILSRTLVYVIVTAFLAGLTAALLGSTQRLFIAITGQSSEVAIVITTLILVAVFTPLRDFVQRSIDARLKAPAPGLKGLRPFAQEVREFAHFSDRERLVMRLLAESVASLEASGGVAEIRQRDGSWAARPTGGWRDDPQVTATIADADGAAARIRLGLRRDGDRYTERQLAQLRDAVNAVAEALAPA